MEITKNTLICDILKQIKGSAEVFESLNMGCLSCMGIQSESLEKGCLMHGLDVEEVIKKIKSIQQ